MGEKPYRRLLSLSLDPAPFSHFTKPTEKNHRKTTQSHSSSKAITSPATIVSTKKQTIKTHTATTLHTKSLHRHLPLPLQYHPCRSLLADEAIIQYQQSPTTISTPRTRPSKTHSSLPVIYAPTPGRKPSRKTPLRPLQLLHRKFAATKLTSDLNCNHVQIESSCRSQASSPV